MFAICSLLQHLRPPSRSLILFFRVSAVAERDFDCIDKVLAARTKKSLRGEQFLFCLLPCPILFTLQINDGLGRVKPVSIGPAMNQSLPHRSWKLVHPLEFFTKVLLCLSVIFKLLRLPLYHSSIQEKSERVILQIVSIVAVASQMLMHHLLLLIVRRRWLRQG